MGSLVSGHASCPYADALDDGEVVGTVAIEPDFSAGSSGSAPTETSADGEDPRKGLGGEADHKPPAG